ncbi:hypothetical protein C8F04DRAFT_1201928 [Mycena alexandri]|uniref:Uncharacterized protein n=1 Tax=Mycena alexandri TaxID=1745969 RepID=A0AAD6RX88_9AGAR|nr:hypothetical protein C8F04DRAFT_1201928 [Mycena alexandri]
MVEPVAWEELTVAACPYSTTSCQAVVSGNAAKYDAHVDASISIVFVVRERVAVKLHLTYMHPKAGVTTPTPVSDIPIVICSVGIRRVKKHELGLGVRRGYGKPQDARPDTRAVASGISRVVSYTLGNGKKSVKIGFSRATEKAYSGERGHGRSQAFRALNANLDDLQGRADNDAGEKVKNLQSAPGSRSFLLLGKRKQQ